eukprot:TRINITY_DN48896_c0_g1_i1.p1 TRINITY_DN48896_c0_g1~~TRINITY_DN48896_c0_g1_i1.p1  ORF type:complete len:391 (-),score=53.63 TRINITY_DN48896_c0_g1_i1:220-1392(-)
MGKIGKKVANISSSGKRNQGNDGSDLAPTSKVTNLLRSPMVLAVAVIGPALCVSPYYWKLSESDSGWRADPQLLATMRKALPNCSDGLPCCDLRKVKFEFGTTIINDTMKREPFIFTGVTNDWAAKALWTKSALRREYGSVYVYSGYPEDFPRGGVRASKVSSQLSSLMDRWDSGDTDLFLFHYAPGQNKGGICRSLRCAFEPSEGSSAEEFSPLEAEGLSHVDDLLVSLGPSSQGVPLHAHGGAWQALVHGKKLWGFLPPDKHPLSRIGMTVKDILKEMTEVDWSGKAPPLFCLQEPGEVLVLPHHWKHATMNIGETISIGAQASNALNHYLTDCTMTLHKEAGVGPLVSLDMCDRHYHPEKDPKKDVANALKEAKAFVRRVMSEAGAN